MKIEKFSSNETHGYKIIGATFASSKNNNGAYFDPIEIFAGEINENFNLGHKDYTTDYSTGTKITKAPTAILDGKLLRFTWDLETTNENFTKLIDAGEFKGFSPELQPTAPPIIGKQIGVSKKNKPIYERFYSNNSLKWKGTAILTKNQTPGFVGADEYELEKFENSNLFAETFEDVVMLKFDDNLIEKETEFEIGCYIKTQSQEIGKIVKIEKTEQGVDYTIKLLDGNTILLNNLSTIQKISINDIMDYIVNMNSKETFNKKIDTIETPDLENTDSNLKFEELQDRITELEAQLKTKQMETPTMPNKIEMFSKQAAVEPKNNQKARQSLINKL
jgi:hypothetical protein